MTDFSIATAVITGAGSGIGAALAAEAADRGATTLFLLDADEASVRQVADGLARNDLRVEAIRCDVTDHAELDRIAEHVFRTSEGPFLVCANAGVTVPRAPLFEADPGNLRWVFEVNLFGCWATLKAFGGRMAAGGHAGWLLVTASEHSVGVPFAGGSGYTASKHAVLGLADVLRRELPPQIGISALLPGLVATGLWQSIARRPERFGGAGEPAPGAGRLMAEGIPPALVARLAFEGMADGRFLIATQTHVKRYAETRWSDVEQAFAALDASDAPKESYDIGEIQARLAAQAEAGKR
ncbi:SDR family NAD(P)-dependent oxidoreductase [Burkholderiaceae bacterium FT117]|uniref:SDR family NAD(P)-dependent oxidoreductase n=1 Tax=Zeimonas sediminis TaxID=2944268 RepID=UPI002342EBF7|nr:SDR family NAD(P)-dependent oxidoreductase [Zeimonas sediminis]MCM5569434.1 SDR family NAD(P)-dependent oxidoreductase [Zeimonas sediminis]